MRIVELSISTLAFQDGDRDRLNPKCNEEIQGFSFCYNSTRRKRHASGIMSGTPEPFGETKECKVSVSCIYIRGFPFPREGTLLEDIIKDALDFKPKDTDILISSFPKSGTNWMSYIVWTIITKGEKPLTSLHELSSEAIPFMERWGTQAAKFLDDPRAVRYHLPYHLIPKNPNAKYIYIFRNPKDVVVSVYYYSINTCELNVTFDVVFEAFMKGLTGYADYFDHVLSWYERRNDPNVLFISYEQLHSNTKKEILKIAKFIGQDYFDVLDANHELVKKILNMVSFNEMKKMENIMTNVEKEKKSRTSISDAKASKFTMPRSVRSPNYKNFFRKGVVSDWKNHLSEEQNIRMNNKIQEKFGNTEIIDMFNIGMETVD